jgi:glycosyltransferase involved in cell wall biosynthesis
VTLAQAAARCPGWRNAIAPDLAAEELFAFPFLGHPVEHLCNELRSSTLTASLLIPTWNSLPSLRACLASLEKSNLNRLAQDRLQVVVCDDGSTDGTWDELTGRLYSLNLLALRLDHRGQSLALNAGLTAAQGDVVIVCDSDMILGCGALDEMLARHERWPAAACFGFRADIDPERLPLTDSALADMMHTEALTGDNRVSFHQPSLVTNMLASCGWLAQLDSGRYLLDCEGSEWRRHRFLYGCLFSAPRQLFEAVGGMPDGLPRWGYQDTLIAAAFEAQGSFLLPVVSATAHHISHPLRHSDQWFQYRRNRLAYDFILDADGPERWWHRRGPRSRVLDRHSCVGVSTSASEPRLVRTDNSLSYFLGLWERFLDQSPAVHPLRRAECLFRTGRYDELIASETDSFWRSAALAAIGRTEQARVCLKRAVDQDQVAEYVSTSSAAELHRLAGHHREQGLADIATYYDIAAEMLGQL